MRDDARTMERTTCGQQAPGGSTLSPAKKSCNLEPQAEGTEFDCPVFDDEQKGNKGYDHQHDHFQFITFHLHPFVLPVLGVARRHLKIARGLALPVGSTIF